MNPPDPNLSKGAAAYCCELERAGWVQIGGGAGGRVFHRNDDQMVIKVSDGDDCYLAFVDYVLATPQDCLPILESVYRSDQWSVTHIERLEPLSDRNAAAVNQWWAALEQALKQNLPLPSPKNWSDVIVALLPIARAGSCNFDMKTANAMQRGSTVVLIDPLN
jgi:hypothetical protein